MWKKLLYSILIVSIITINLKIVIGIDEDESLTEQEIIEVINQKTNEPKINSKIAVAYDRTSGRVIWGKNEDKKTAMASTTKIMTAIVALENCNLQDIVEVSQKSANTGGSRLGLKKGDKISMNDLLYGLMLVSGNDSAVAIAEKVGGSVEGFANLMNNKANELGLKNTHFVTPHGLDNPEHYTTATELAKIADYALKNEKFAEIVSTKNYNVKLNGYSKNLSNTNELLGVLNGVNGVKTGFTNNAGRCLVTSVKRDGFEIITVVLQADTKKIRTADSISLIEYVYNNYKLVNLKEIVDEQFLSWCEINKNRIVINKCKTNNLELYISDLQNEVIPVNKKDIDNIEIVINQIYYVEAPIESDTRLGTLKIFNNGELIDTLYIKNKYTVEKRNIYDYLNMFAIRLFS